ncbi:MAG TPA: ribulose-phosphate 3-epimerase [Actinomycetota bacterium]|nr:ribulose-phosphate 3-epimerase [Actinomycetota bacterium]
MADIAPSVIAADYSRLEQSLSAVAPHSVRWHVDVMDGHYVPNLTIGPMIVEAIASFSELPQDVHLMIKNPSQTWRWYAKAGAARIAFHPEAADDAGRLLAEIADAGLGAGLAVNPDVAPETVIPHLEMVDHLVMMSVNPGFSGQAFIPSVLPKLRVLRERIDAGGLKVQLVVDGGVGLDTGRQSLEAGAHVLVSASSIFAAPDPAGSAAALAALPDR